MNEKDLVLIIDMQNAYAPAGAWECADIGRACRNIVKLLENGNDVDFAFTRFLYDPFAEGVWKNYNDLYSSINLDERANAIMPGFAKYLEKHPVYDKSVYSSLSNDELKRRCRHAKRVVLCGVVAECCVLSTLFSLVDEGIGTVYLEDAVSGLTTSNGNHALEIVRTLSPLHVSIMSTQEYLDEGRIGDVGEYIRNEVRFCYHEKNLNCARTSMRVYSALFSTDLPEELTMAAAGMHGAGRFGAQCGLVEGTLMFIGCYFLSRKVGEDEAVAACHDIAEAITDEFGSLDCRDLRKGGFRPDDPPHLCENLSVRMISFCYQWMKKRLEDIASGRHFQTATNSNTIQKP